MGFASKWIGRRWDYGFFTEHGRHEVITAAISYVIDVT